MSDTILPLNPPVAGYVAPTATNGELNDVSLFRFLQQLVVGVTGMKPTMVFPRWQAEPPNQPGFDDDWAAVGEIRRERDTFAAVLHSTSATNFDDSQDQVIRNQIIEALCSFYGPDCEANSELFTMGLFLAQNREAIFLNGFALVEVEETVIAPDLLKERWVKRADVPFRIRRQQIYTYPVPNLKYASVEIKALQENGAVLDVDASYLEGYDEAPYDIEPYGE